MSNEFPSTSNDSPSPPKSSTGDASLDNQIRALNRINAYQLPPQLQQLLDSIKLAAKTNQYFKAFSLDENYQSEDLNNAWKVCAKQCHPDKNIGNEQAANDIFACLAAIKRYLENK